MKNLFAARRRLACGSLALWSLLMLASCQAKIEDLQHGIGWRGRIVVPSGLRVVGLRGDDSPQVIVADSAGRLRAIPTDGFCAYPCRIDYAP